jgi:hypothetical protein
MYLQNSRRLLCQRLLAPSLWMLCSLLSQPSIAEDGAPYVLSSEKGGFSVVMPGTPTSGPTTHHGEDFRWRQGKDVIYSVDYGSTELPPIKSKEEQQQMLDKSVHNVVNGLGGQQAHVNKLSLPGGQPGREFEMVVPAQNLWFRMRQYYVDGKLYMFAVQGSQDTIHSPAAERFFRSFVLNEPSSESSVPGNQSWQTISSDKGKFSVLMPGKPAVKPGKHEGEIFDLAEPEKCSECGYRVVYRKPDSPSMSQEAAQSWLEALANEQAHHGSDCHMTKMDTLPGSDAGLEMECTTQSGTLFQQRMFATKDYLYLLIATGTEAYVHSPATEKFMHSFKLLP